MPPKLKKICSRCRFANEKGTAKCAKCGRKFKKPLLIRAFDWIAKKFTLGEK